MVVGKRIMIDAVVDFRVWVPCSFSTELPYRPVFAMLGVEELYERVERVAVCALRICAAGSGCRDDCT
jgi:hypothetical protein